MQSIDYKTKFGFLVLVYGLLLLTWVNFNHSMFKCNNMPSKVWNGAEKLLFEQMLTGFIVHRCDTRGGWVDPSFVKRFHIFIYKIITRSVYTIKYNWHSTDRPSVLDMACFLLGVYSLIYIMCLSLVRCMHNRVMIYVCFKDIWLYTLEYHLHIYRPRQSISLWSISSQWLSLGSVMAVWCEHPTVFRPHETELTTMFDVILSWKPICRLWM